MECFECEGSGWTCSECGENGVNCECGHDAEAIDCQSCQGTGEADEEEGGEGTDALTEDK